MGLSFPGVSAEFGPRPRPDSGDGLRPAGPPPVGRDKRPSRVSCRPEPRRWECFWSHSWGAVAHRGDGVETLAGRDHRRRSPAGRISVRPMPAQAGSPAAGGRPLLIGEGAPGVRRRDHPSRLPGRRTARRSRRRLGDFTSTRRNSSIWTASYHPGRDSTRRVAQGRPRDSGPRLWSGPRPPAGVRAAGPGDARTSVSGQVGGRLFEDGRRSSVDSGRRWETSKYAVHTCWPAPPVRGN